jgi:lysophospholipase L1-like esterase
LETFVKVFISENNTDDCLVVVQTLTGTFEYTFKYQYKWNGAVKVQSNGAELTNCKLSATNPTLKKSVWMFGDSYFGADGDSRQMYWLKKWGFIDNVLVQSYAGQGSAAAYSDLERCLFLGSPKYIVWCLGMNDDNGSDLSDITTGNWYKIFEKVKYTCDIKGITLILATIPNVRGTNYRNKDAMSDIVRNSGQRYIDVAKAVGSSSEGTWYGDGTDYDYQSTDNVHPTMYGAQAIATQILVDFPEIMQY